MWTEYVFFLKASQRKNVWSGKHTALLKAIAQMLLTSGDLNKRSKAIERHFVAIFLKGKAEMPVDRKLGICLRENFVGTSVDSRRKKWNRKSSENVPGYHLTFYHCRRLEFVRRVSYSYVPSHQIRSFLAILKWTRENAIQKNKAIMAFMTLIIDIISREDVYNFWNLLS